MAKEFKGEELPGIPARQGNPEGVQAEDDVTFKGAVVVRKGEFYSRAYLTAIDEGCATKTAKKAPQDA